MKLISKYKIARSMGVSHTAVYKWFGGKCLPSADKLIKLAELLEIPPAELLSIFKKR